MTKGPLYRPPPGASGWTGLSEFPLLYLAWGERRYGRSPLAPVRHDDWMYVAPRSGAPTVLLAGRRHILKSEECLILSPGCISGYDDSPSGRCEIQTWIWRDMPIYARLRPTAHSFQIIRLARPQVAELEKIHLACREEVQDPDTFTSDALSLLRARLDLCLVRGPSSRIAPPSPSQRIALALRWLREHLDQHAPASGLCDYLQVSPATLHRLFRDEFGYGPREAALRLRLQEAARLVTEEKWSVKAAAYHLGYKFPNDLSRAVGKQRQP